ncbi:MAG: N-acetylmuramoyl-L-alanine amidase [Chthoniobacterales bacterium]
MIRMRRSLFAFCFIACAASSGVVLALPSPTDSAAKRRAERVRSQPAPTPPPAVPSAPQTTRQNSYDPTVVVIDAGHGGHDRGGIYGQRVSEKMVTLDVAQRLRAVLSAQGYRVVMTRDSDVFIPLGMRVGIANAYPNAIFICIHFNAARRGGANGIETYFYSRDSLPLASAIHYYVAGGAPTSNRGVRRRGYYVLRKTRIPAVLVECGFLTNPTEAQYAQSNTYRQQLADEIARGIRERSLVVHPASANRYAATGTLPLQPYLDLTKVRDPDISRSKHSSKKSSRSKSARRKKTHTSSEADAKKRTTVESTGSAP